MILTLKKVDQRVAPVRHLKENDEAIQTYITGIRIFLNDALNISLPGNLRWKIMMYSATQVLQRSVYDEGTDHETKYYKKACMSEVCILPKGTKLLFFSIWIYRIYIFFAFRFIN